MVLVSSHDGRYHTEEVCCSVLSLSLSLSLSLFQLQYSNSDSDKNKLLSVLLRKCPNSISLISAVVHNENILFGAQNTHIGANNAISRLEKSLRSNFVG